MYISQTSLLACLTRESPLMWAFVVLRAKNAAQRFKIASRLLRFHIKFVTFLTAEIFKIWIQFLCLMHF